MIDYKGRVESYSREMLRKESQIKELQTRMEAGDGCEYLLPVTLPSALFSREILDSKFSFESKLKTSMPS